MKTSLTTSEHRIRDWLLDLLHSQWRALGVPLSVPRPAPHEEAIDPEALLWCSLEFFPTQPRFKEQALAWWCENDQAVLVPRIGKFGKIQGDPKILNSRALGTQRRSDSNSATVPRQGWKSVEELTAFRADFQRQTKALNDRRHQPGKAETTNSTVILRARDLLGNDARHFILVHLLSNHGHAKLRSVAAWSGQSYRNISKVARRWEAIDVLSVEHGFARLKNPAPWESLLALRPRRIVLVNWPRFFTACVSLLRALEKARGKSMPTDGPVVAALIRQAADEATASIESEPSNASTTIQDFRLLLSSL